MLFIRKARETDLPALENMVADFVKGHPAEKHPRSRQALHDAYFGTKPVTNLVVAERSGELVGMIQWQLIHDMFWGMFGARAEWLYVKPHYRGSGICAALVARICADSSAAGAQFLQGGGGDGPSKLYERVAIGMESRDCFLSGKAFQAFSKLDGLAPREIVRKLPTQDMSRQPAER
jgi:N-acetylglutamate synthase-like GNAT family acetyltransferase